MDPKTADLVARWRASLTQKERDLHDLAAVMLKKKFVQPGSDLDNGSYFPEKSKAFQAWMKALPKGCA
jgi:hypothetical protein